jgi:hypothetical protein
LAGDREKERESKAVREMDKGMLRKLKRKCRRGRSYCHCYISTKNGLKRVHFMTLVDGFPESKFVVANISGMVTLPYHMNQ